MNGATWSGLHETLRQSLGILVNIPVLLAVDVASHEEPSNPALENFLRELGGRDA